MILSKNAQDGAERLIAKLENQELKMDSIPNSMERYDEQKDYVSFCRFLKSRNGRIVSDSIDKKGV